MTFWPSNDLSLSRVYFSTKSHTSSSILSNTSSKCSILPRRRYLSLDFRSTNASKISMWHCLTVYNSNPHLLILVFAILFNRSSHSWLFITDHLSLNFSFTNAPPHWQESHACLPVVSVTMKARYLNCHILLPGIAFLQASNFNH